MGFNMPSYHRYHYLLERLKIDKKNSIVVEFGAQQNWYASKSFPKSTYFQINFKDTYKAIHTFDFVKEHEQVEQVDLRKEMVLPYKADIITDMGTLEHIEGDMGLYTAWKNFHNACAKGGLMIHWLPEKGSFPDHPKCFYWYDTFFMGRLAYANSYQVLELERVNVKNQGYCIWAAMYKMEDNQFMSYEQFWDIW